MSEDPEKKARAEILRLLAAGGRALQRLEVADMFHPPALRDPWQSNLLPQRQELPKTQVFAKYARERDVGCAKQKAPASAGARCLKRLVGRVGIEPTTNGLRV